MRGDERHEIVLSKPIGSSASLISDMRQLLGHEEYRDLHRSSAAGSTGRSGTLVLSVPKELGGRKTVRISCSNEAADRQIIAYSPVTSVWAR